MNKKIPVRDAVFFAVILVLVLVILYSGHRILVSTVFAPNQEEAEPHSSKIIVRDGVKYFPRQDITTMLIMGVDQFGPVEDSGAYTNVGAADVNILLIFDETEKQCNVLHLNRDTMLEMPVLGVGGREAGTYYGQLALAHTYGSGMDDSCRNVCKAVSWFLEGIDIHYYLSMNMDAIAIFNDAVGGVTVNVTEDFSQVDESIGMGQVRLLGDQAIHFVRTRKGVGDQKNTSRIQRHKAYLDGFVAALREKQASGTEFILTAYEEVMPYIVTNCSANAVSGMVERYSGYTINEVMSPEGNNVRGETYYEFYADEEKLDEWVLQYLFAPVK